MIPAAAVVAPLPAAVQPKPPEGAFEGLKKLWGGFQEPKLEEDVPAVPIPSLPKPNSAPVAPTPISVAAPAASPTTPPASSNIEEVRPYEPPNLLNSFQQLFN